MVRRAEDVEPRPWGDGCQSWDLRDGDDLRFTEERMPPATAEVAHHHAQARQFFYVLNGQLTIEVDGAVTHLRAREGLEVPPGARHRVRNDSSEDVEFVVVASPTTRDDRVDEH